MARVVRTCQHGKQHGRRQQGIGSRCQQCFSAGGRRIALDHTQGNFLRWPNNHPYIGGHNNTHGRANDDVVIHLAIMLYATEQYYSGKKRKHGAPTEPPERTGRQFLLGIGKPFRRRLLEVTALHKIKIIQHPYPGNSEQYMPPTRDKVNRFNRHYKLRVIVYAARSASLRCCHTGPTWVLTGYPSWVRFLARVTAPIRFCDMDEGSTRAYYEMEFSVV